MPDNEWTVVLENNGQPREPLSERIISGIVTAEGWDYQNDFVKKEALLKNIVWIAQNADMSYQHGVNPTTGEPDFIGLGRFHKWRMTKDAEGNDAIEMEASVKPPGSDLLDRCWNEIKGHAEGGGFSIGGRSLEKFCDGNRCTITKADVVEIAWTPRPCRSTARVTGGNFMAKDEKEDEEEDVDKCNEDKKKFEKAVHDGNFKTAQDAISACGSCADYFNGLIQKGEKPDKALLKLQLIIDNQRGEMMTKDEKKEEETIKKEEEKSDLKDVKEEKETKQDEKKPEDDKKEEKSKKSEEVTRAEFTDLTNSVSEMKDSLTKTTESIEALMKAISGKEDKSPPPPEEPKITTEQALIKLHKDGFTVEGVHFGSTGAPSPTQTGREGMKKTVEQIKTRKKIREENLQDGLKKTIERC